MQDISCSLNHVNGPDGLGFGDGKVLISGSDDRTVRAWELGSQRELVRLGGHAGAITHLALSPSDGTVVSASEDGAIRLRPRPVAGDDSRVLLDRALADFGWHLDGMQAVADPRRASIRIERR